MFRRICASSRVSLASVAVATVQQQQRSVYWFSNCSHTLETIQKEKGYECDLWVEESERRFRGFDVKEGAKPHAARLTKQLELYNLDEVVIPDETRNLLPEISDHTSFSTQKKYGETLRFELQNRAELKGYNSKWWIAPATLRKRGFTVQNQRQASTIVLIEANCSVFNGSQLVDPSQLTTFPISGGSRRIFIGAEKGKGNPVFHQHQQEHGLPTCVYYSEQQASTIGLHPAEGAVPLETSFEGTTKQVSKFVIYNATMLENSDEILNGRHTAFATFLTPHGAGNPIKSDTIRTAIEQAPEYPSNFWVSSRDLEKFGWSLKQGTETQGIDLSGQTGRMGGSVRFFNVDQFADPAKARAAVGTLVR